MSHGLVIATAFATAYLVVGAVADVRVSADDRREPSSGGNVALFLVVLPIAALPILVPHVDFLGESSLRGGYGALGEAGQTEIGDPLGSDGVWAAWPLGFASAPGRLRGRGGALVRPRRGSRVAVSVRSCGGRRARARGLRPHVLVPGRSGWFRSLMLEIPFGDVYLHNPGRLRYVVVLALPILAAAGTTGPRRTTARAAAAIAWLGAAAVAFFLWPLAAGGSAVRFGMFALVLRGRRAAALRVRHSHLALGVGHRARRGARRWSCLASAVYAQTYEGGTVFTGLETGEHPVPRAAGPALPRSLSESDYLGGDADRRAPPRPPGALRHVGAARRVLREGLPVDEVSPRLAGARSRRGSLFGSRTRSATTPCSSLATGATSAARTSSRSSTTPRCSTCPSPEDVRVLGFRYLVVPERDRSRRVGGRVVEDADGYSLWELGRLATARRPCLDQVEFVDDLAGGDG